MTAGMQQETKLHKSCEVDRPIQLPLTESHMTNSPVDYWPSGGGPFSQLTNTIISQLWCLLWPRLSQMERHERLN